MPKWPTAPRPTAGESPHSHARRDATRRDATARHGTEEIEEPVGKPEPPVPRLVVLVRVSEPPARKKAPRARAPVPSPADLQMVGWLRAFVSFHPRLSAVFTPSNLSSGAGAMCFPVCHQLTDGRVAAAALFLLVTTLQLVPFQFYYYTGSKLVSLHI